MYKNELQMLRDLPRLMAAGTLSIMNNEDYFKSTLIMTSIIITYPFFAFYIPLIAAFPAKLVMSLVGSMFHDSGANNLHLLIDIPLAIARFLLTYVVGFMAFVFITWMLVNSMIRVKRRSNFFKSLFKLYVEIICIFSLYYFYLILNSPSNGYFIQGIDFLGTTLADWINNPVAYLHTYFQCFYFSAVTVFTLGAGNMMPSSVVVEVLIIVKMLISLYVVVRLSMAKK